MAETIRHNYADAPRASLPTVEPTEDLPAVMKDVWFRSGSKHRIRAVVLLAVNVLLFAGVGSFAFWLRSGTRFAPMQEGYWDELTQTFLSVPFTGQRGVSLGSFLLEPISVQDVPMQIPILGLLMAALISIPVLVSILYRFWSSLPFVAVVGFLAVMPWLAVTLLGSCIIASVRPLRTRFRFMSALLGLLPAVVYLVLAWLGTAEAVGGRIDPIDRIKFVAPWVLAIVAATMLFAIVLGIARVVDYRPGAIAPLLAVMLGLPVALFEFHVGRDELYYRLLETLNNAHFEDEDASVDLDQAVSDKWLRRPPPRGSMAAVREAVEMQWFFSDIGPAQTALSRHQAELVERANRFLTYFPHSRYALNALFIKARALDMRVDPGEFRRTKWIRFYDDFPSAASRLTWRIILENSPDTMLGAVALLRLAQLDAREGDIERAISKLTTLIARLDFTEPRAYARAETVTQAGPLKGVLARESPEVSLEIPRERILLKAHCLHHLLTANRDPLYRYDPISGARHRDESFSFGLLDLDPRHDGYLANLETLKARYPHCQVQDNLDLEIAKNISSPAERIERLEHCLETYAHQDTVPEVLFRLGVAYKEIDQPGKSEEALRRLAREYPNSVWRRQAARYAVPGRVFQVARARAG